MPVSLDTQRRGGFREGAGRPKKKKSELQKTHSVRATDKDWKEIQTAVRVIKGCQATDKRPRVFLLRDNEFRQVNQLLIEGLIEKRYGDNPVEAETPAKPEPEKIEITSPRTVSEEEAVSLFLEYYRMNPYDAVSSMRSKLEKERRKKALREERRKHTKTMNKLEQQAEDAMRSIDDINERVARMLQFSGIKA